MVTWQQPMKPNGIVKFYRVEYTYDVEIFSGSADDIDKEFSGSADDIDKEFSGSADDIDKEFSGSADDIDKEFSGSTDDVVNEIITTNTSVIITMLEKFTTYEVQVFATTISEGDGSDVVTVTTDEDGT